MMARRVFLVCLLLAGLGAIAAWAADVTGKWVAEVPGRQGQTMQMTFNFKQEGEKLTGTISTPRGESPISDGKVVGDQISFTQVVEFGGNQMKFLYKGKVVGHEIRFTREREGGQGPGPQAREFVAKRMPS
ncbi:MAG: hypothetical protein ACP5U2_13835 [Bryobacteraceae bacterium]